MKNNSHVFIIKSVLFSACFVLALLLGAAAGFAAGPPEGEGFDFTNDESVIDEQLKGDKKDEEEQQKRIVTRASLENDMKVQLGLLQEAAACYQSSSPLEFADKCTPSLHKLQSFRFNLQALRGGQIQYTTNAEKSAMMGAAALFDELYPNAVQLIAWLADTISYEFAKSYNELKKQKQWYDETHDSYLKNWKEIDNLIAKGTETIKRLDNEVVSNKNKVYFVDMTRTDFLYEFGFFRYMISSGNQWFPGSGGSFIFDMDGHFKILQEKMKQYGEQYEYASKELTKFDPFFAKWKPQIEKIAAPYNAYLVKLLDIVKNSQEVFAAHGLVYGEILQELESNDGLGAFASGKIKDIKWMYPRKGVSYSFAVHNALENMWNMVVMTQRTSKRNLDEMKKNK